MIDLDWRVIGIIALVLGGIAITFRLLGQYAIQKLVTLEYEHVLNSDEHKVRGKFE